MPENAMSEPTVKSPTKEFNLIDDVNPRGAPLTAKYKLGFAFKTVNQRLPIILTKVIDQLSRDKNEISDLFSTDAKEEVKSVVGALAKLKNEMVTNKPIYKTERLVWDLYLQHIAKLYFEGNEDEVTWYQAPWLHVECYFYRRINDAFKLTNHLKSFDPFRKQKEEGFMLCRTSAALLGESVMSSSSSDEVLQSLLEVGLWGNRCDLSLSNGEDVSQLGNLVDQLQELRKYIICDESANMWKILKAAKESSTGNPISIGYVLDNASFELFTDFCLADKLMERVDRIDFYVKTTPWFISDTMSADFHWLLEEMSTCTDLPVLVTLAERWKGYVATKRWTIVESDFWTFPHAFHEMKDVDPELYTTLAQHTHLIFKGDLNYRKLIGDFNWAPDTPFKEALRGFTPAPLLTLRTLKADCIAGLKKGVAEETANKSSNWLLTGEYGVIQHAQ